MTLKKIPFHVWSRNIILTLASALGKPLCLDDITTSQRFLSYTHVLVEFNLSKALPTSIGMDIEGANPVNIPVEIEKLPCSTCLKPGHTTLSYCQTTGIRPITPTVDNPLPKLVPHPTCRRGYLGPSLSSLPTLYLALIPPKGGIPQMAPTPQHQHPMIVWMILLPLALMVSPVLPTSKIPLTCSTSAP